MYTETNERGIHTMENNIKKVWGFNCYGVCICLIAEDKVEAYNAKHGVISEKIKFTKPY